MFRGYAKFPGVGIRAMPVVCRSFDLIHLLPSLFSPLPLPSLSSGLVRYSECDRYVPGLCQIPGGRHPCHARSVLVFSVKYIYSSTLQMFGVAVNNITDVIFRSS